MLEQATRVRISIHNRTKWKHTKGGLRYSMPILRAFLDVFKMSFIRLYLSTRKLRVGPEERRTIRNDGATGVKVNASRCVT